MPNRIPFSVLNFEWLEVGTVVSNEEALKHPFFDNEAWAGSVFNPHAHTHTHTLNAGPIVFPFSPILIISIQIKFRVNDAVHADLDSTVHPRKRSEWMQTLMERAAIFLTPPRPSLSMKGSIWLLITA